MSEPERGNIMNEKKFGKDEVIFREGDHGTSFFQIVERKNYLFGNTN